MPSDSMTTDFYSLNASTLEGKPFSFSSLKGKKVLIVNTASECGFTGQYADLQKLHESYGNKVTILGFPCNDFGGQEPGKAEQIQSFCQRNYGVTFQMMEKVNIKTNPHPVYAWLSAKEKNGWNSEAPSWNFGKYLINEQGKLTHFFPSTVNPMGDKILEVIK